MGLDNSRVFYPWICGFNFSSSEGAVVIGEFLFNVWLVSGVIFMASNMAAVIWCIINYIR